MTDIIAQDFAINASLALPADKHSAVVPSADLFLNANDADTVKLGAGFIDAATMIPYETGQAEGLIEEWSIDVSHESLKCKVGGRDRMAELLEREYNMSYLTAWPTEAQKIEMQAAGREFKVGWFQASTIAREIATFCGMELIWNCRDYKLREDFTTNGRAIDQIQKLLDPWKQIPRYQVDLFVMPGVDGPGAIVCRARDDYQICTGSSGQFIPSPNCTFTAKDARIKSITVSRKRSQRYKHVLLYGEIVPVGFRNRSGTEFEEESESVTLDENGRILTKTTTRTTYLMPDKRVVKVIVSTYHATGSWRLDLVKKETRETEWEPSQYSEFGGLINDPKELSQTSMVEAIVNGTWRQQSKEYVSYAYDSQGYLDVTATRKWKLNPTSYRLEEYERQTKEHREPSHLETEEVTTLFKPKTSGPGITASNPSWYPAQVDTNRSAGIRPGGPKPPRAVSDSGPRRPVIVKEDISDHPRARSVVFQNSSLTRADLDYLMGCFRTSSGNWEWTIQMAYLGIPWLRKGMVIAITDLQDNNGVDIPLQPALVTEQRLRYDESSDKPSMVSTLVATFWTSDAGD